MVDFRIEVRIDPSRAQAGARTVRRALDSTTRASSALGASLRRAFGVVASGVALTAVVRTLASFSQEMSTVGAVANATQAQFAALEDRAISLGTNTRFSATQAAEGMTFLARAGFNADEVLGSIEGTLKLAQAGALGLGEAADIASNVLKGMRLEVEETARVVDVLALAANSSNTTVSQLGQALKFVAPVAAGVNVELEDTTAAISALSDAGLQASTAGTGLRRVLATLEQGGPQLAAALQGTGITLDDVRVSSVGLTTALENIGKAGIDTGTALEIFGQRGGPAFEVLRTAGGDIEVFADRLREADGTAERIAETMDDNLNGALLRVRSAFEGLTLEIGRAGATETLTQSFDGLAVALRFAADNAEILTAVSLVFATSALPALITGTIAWIKQLTIARTIAGSGALFNPIVAGAAAAAAATLGLVTLYENRLNKAVRESTRELDDFVAAAEGTDLEQLERQIANIEKTLSRVQGVEGAEENVAQLNSVLDELRQQFEELSQPGGRSLELIRQEAEAMKQLATAVDLTSTSIRSQAEARVGTNRELEIQQQVLEEIQRLEERTGALVSPDQEKTIREAFEAAQAFRDQADALESIRGPQQEFEARLNALQALESAGKISTDELTAAVASLAEEFEGADLSAFEGQLEGIREQLAAQREATLAELERKRIIDSLKSPEEELLERKRILTSLLDDETVNQERLAAALREVDEALNPISEKQQRLNDLIQEIRGPEQERNQRIMDLNELLALNAATFGQAGISLAEYRAEMEKLNETLPEVEQKTRSISEELSTGLQDGLKAGVAGITDISGAASTLVVNGFGAAEDAIVQFATTGEADIGALVDGILEDLARLLARQALFGLIRAFGGGTFLDSLSSFGTGQGSAEGGRRDVEPGRPLIVGEGGRRELFVPEGAGDIMSAAQVAAAANGDLAGQQAAPVSPEVNVTVVNSSDPNDTIAAMDSAQGRQLILNTISQNPTAIRNALS